VRELPISADLETAYRSAGAMYQAGDVAAARERLAMNFLLDRDAEGWSRDLAKLKAHVGECETIAPIKPTGALSGDFTWRCTHGRIQGTLALAPTRPALIQAWELEAIAP
jgi:hypothetical protein